MGLSRKEGSDGGELWMQWIVGGEGCRVWRKGKGLWLWNTKGIRGRAWTVEGCWDKVVQKQTTSCPIFRIKNWSSVGNIQILWDIFLGFVPPCFQQQLLDISFKTFEYFSFIGEHGEISWETNMKSWSIEVPKCVLSYPSIFFLPIIPASFCLLLCWFPPCLLPFLIFTPSFHLLPSSSVFPLCMFFFPLVFPTLPLPFPLHRSPFTSSSSLQHLCPCRGGVPEKRKPPGQSGTSQMVSKLHLHYLFSPLPLFLYGQCFTMTRCSCDISHLSAADMSAHKGSTYLGVVCM